jgi:hypothetical protein
MVLVGKDNTQHTGKVYYDGIPTCTSKIPGRYMPFIMLLIYIKVELGY